jgi:DNA-binding PadR family transcriptional regulator
VALRDAVLAALLEGEASGYELAKRFDVSVANFWSATPQQLYRELDRLEADGLVEARLVQQTRRPNKRLFKLSPAGRDALHQFTSQPTRPAALRDELLVKLQAFDVGDTAAVRAALEERLANARAKLALYDGIQDSLLDGESEEQHLETAERIGPYLTLLGGRMYERQNIRWCLRVLDILARRDGKQDAHSQDEVTTR